MIGLFYEGKFIEKYILEFKNVAFIMNREIVKRNIITMNTDI
jgi:hypothetical protein